MDKKKLIIKNKTDLSMPYVLDLVSNVISAGRVSGDGKHYAYATLFPTSNSIVVYKENRCSDYFLIYSENNTEEV